MSGSLAALAGLYDPETGLARNRNDPRYAMAQKLLEQKTPDSIPGKGAAMLTGLAGAFRGMGAAKLMMDARDDGKAAGEKQQAESAAFLQSLGMGSGAAPASPAAPAEPSAFLSPTDAPRLAAGPQQGAAPSPAGDLASAVHNNESSGRMEPGIRGDGGLAAGPMQVHAGALADVNKRLGTAYTHDQLAAQPEIGKRVGEEYLAMQKEKFGRDDYALGAYNAGPGAMDRAIASGQGVAGLPASTQRYVAKGMSALGPQMAAKMDVPPVESKGPALAARMDPDKLQQAAIYASQSPNPSIRAMAPVLSAQARQAVSARDRADQQGQRSAERADLNQQRRQDVQDRDRQRAEDRAFQADQNRQNRQTATTQLMDPDGKIGLYAIGPDGTPGKRIGDAANQREPAQHPVQTAQLMDPDGKIGLYAMNPDGSTGRRIGDAANQREPKPEPPPRNVQTVSTADGVFVVNPDGTTGNRLGGLPREAEKPLKAPSDAVVKAVTTNMRGLRNLDGALDAVEKNPDAFGEMQYIPGIGRRAPQANIDARAQVANIGSLVIHERSGAAVSASEFPRLQPFIPAATDPPEMVKTKLRRFRAELQGMLQDQHDIYGPSNGYRAVPGLSRALGIEDEGAPQATDASVGPKGLTQPIAAVGETGTPSVSSSADRRRAAVDHARSLLGPGASDDDVIRKATELVGR